MRHYLLITDVFIAIVTQRGDTVHWYKRSWSKRKVLRWWIEIPLPTIGQF